MSRHVGRVTSVHMVHEVMRCTFSTKQMPKEVQLTIEYNYVSSFLLTETRSLVLSVHAE